MSTLFAMKERLADLKKYRLNEQRSAQPSLIYIEDLTLSIDRLEKQIEVQEATMKDGYLHVGKI